MVVVPDPRCDESENGDAGDDWPAGPHASFAADYCSLERFGAASCQFAEMKCRKPNSQRHGVEKYGQGA